MRSPNVNDWEIKNIGHMAGSSPRLTPMRSKQMFGKNDLVDNLSRDLGRARDKRDALASHVTTLTTPSWRLVFLQKAIGGSASALWAKLY
jgi:hypothetical protein